MRDLHDLELLLLSHTPLIFIESLEEVRILQFLSGLSPHLPYPLYKWSVTEGVSRLDVDYGRIVDTEQPLDALRHVKKTGEPGYWAMLDLHPWLQDPVCIRFLKEIGQGFADARKYLLLLSHEVSVPNELRHLSAKFEISLPDQATIKRLIREEAQSWKQRKGKSVRVQTDEPILERLSANLMGVTETDARRLIAAAIETDGALTVSDLPEVMKAKYELIGGDGVISFEYESAQFSDIGGLRDLKTWLRQRQKALLEIDGKRDRPKGIMLLGVQGAGKSLAAKAVAGTFGIPLLRLDFATLYNKYHGETERNLRAALRTADVMAPCVLWIDEIEKGVALNDSDDGLSRRVLGTLLTWMAERKSPVFIVATSNDIERLPPELVRKGRLDEIFFVDLPDQDTREEIFAIHLRRRDLRPENFDLTELAAASAGFSGAEIEQAVVSTLYDSETRDASLTSGDIVQELGRTRPLSVVMADRIAALRLWAAERTVAAG